MARQPLTPRAQRRAGYWLLGGGAALALRSWNLLPLHWSCPFRQVAGVPCPTCFLTRSLLAAFRGDLAGSLAWHPLGIPLLLGAAAITLALLGGRLTDPRRLGRWAVAVPAALVVVWLIRLWGWSRGVPLPDSGPG